MICQLPKSEKEDGKKSENVGNLVRGERNEETPERGEKRRGCSNGEPSILERTDLNV